MSSRAYQSLVASQFASLRQTDGLEETNGYRFTATNPRNPACLNHFIHQRIVGSSLRPSPSEGLHPITAANGPWSDHCLLNVNRQRLLLPPNVAVLLISGGHISACLFSLIAPSLFRVQPLITEFFYLPAFTNKNIVFGFFRTIANDKPEISIGKFLNQRPPNGSTLQQPAESRFARQQ